MYLTVLFEDPFWVGIFERNDGKHYSVAREVFGAEPTDIEVYQFVISKLSTLRFTTPIKEDKKKIRKINPKRLQREVIKSSQKATGVSKAQDVMRIELEKNKKISKEKSKLRKEMEEQRKFDLKQAKKKKKQKGH